MTHDINGPITDVLPPGQRHPAADMALLWVQAIPYPDLVYYQGVLHEQAKEGNLLAEVCSKTMDRFLNDGRVNDRLFLGLAWILRDMVEERQRLEGLDDG